MESQKCPTCGQSVNEREIGLFKELVSSLWVVFQWCENRGKYEFKRKEVKHLFKTDNIIARFGDLVLFGGLVYRPDGKKGNYGINIERTKNFFAGRLEIPTLLIKNPLTKEIKREQYRRIDDIPYLKAFLDENYEYISNYRNSLEFDEEGQGKLF